MTRFSEVSMIVARVEVEKEIGPSPEIERQFQSYDTYKVGIQVKVGIEFEDGIVGMIEI